MTFRCKITIKNRNLHPLTARQVNRVQVSVIKVARQGQISSINKRSSVL